MSSRLDAAFRAVADPTRRKILALLAEEQYHCKKETYQVAGICVQDLVTYLSMPQSTVSRHLGVLHQAGLVSVHKNGLWRYYVREEGRLQELIDDLRLNKTTQEKQHV